MSFSSHNRRFCEELMCVPFDNGPKLKDEDIRGNSFDGCSQALVEKYLSDLIRALPSHRVLVPRCSTAVVVE